jgi:hypothetical protein
MPLDKSELERLGNRIRERGQIVNCEWRFPSGRQAAEVQILIYADGSARLDGGSFWGMNYVYTFADKNRTFSYINFHVDFAHPTCPPVPINMKTSNDPVGISPSWSWPQNRTQNAVKTLSKEDTVGAIDKLESFINEVAAQKGKHVVPAD